MRRNFVKKLCGVVLAGVCMAGLCACGASNSESANSSANASTQAESGSTASNSGEQIADPFTDYDSLEEAEKATGFDITLPDAPEGYSSVSYRADSEGKLIEVIYSDKALSDDSAKEGYRVRKAEGSSDVSGDYNEYSNVETEDISGNSVTIKGEGDTVYLATWTSGNYSYSVSFAADGFSKADVEKIVAAIQ